MRFLNTTTNEVNCETVWYERDELKNFQGAYYVMMVIFDTLLLTLQEIKPSITLLVFYLA